MLTSDGVWPGWIQVTGAGFLSTVTRSWLSEGFRGQHKRWCFAYQGNRMEAIGSAWKRALRRAGIEKFRFHDLRHTWASWHVMSGTSLRELMELGGWKSYEMVLRYAHLAPEHLSTAAARIERELEVVTTGATISLR